MDKGARLRKARLAKGLTLRDVSERTGISFVYLGEIERGKKPGSAKALKQLAKFFHIPLDDLIDG